jgi:tRNA(Ile)-lysidine synthase
MPGAAPSLTALVRATIRRHAMLAGGERVLVAVSGGADSVALLATLLELDAELRLDLHVAHIDHQLRPDSAADARFVEALGARLGVPVLVERVEVARAGSPEAAARSARHAALERLRQRHGAARIALGHTADDQAETLLMRVLDGAGVRGLAAIPAVRGPIIRPLIDARRRDIEAALRRAGFDWMEDPTNRDERFRRNRIRHDVLPALAAAGAGDVVPALVRTAALAREATAALDAMASRELARLAIPAADGGITLPLSGLRSLPSSVAPEVLRQAAAGLGSTAPLRAWGHRGLARILAPLPPRRPFRLGGVVVEVSGDRVRLGRTLSGGLETRPLAVPGRTPLPEIHSAIEATVHEVAGYRVPREKPVAAFDADLVPVPLAVRARRRGDRLVTADGLERRLKSLLIASRIPRWDRSLVPIVDAAGEILWVAGVRRAATAPLTDRTRRVLQLALVPDAQN